jgi:hypothetical protein
LSLRTSWCRDELIESGASSPDIGRCAPDSSSDKTVADSLEIILPESDPDIFTSDLLEETLGKADSFDEALRRSNFDSGGFAFFKESFDVLKGVVGQGGTIERSASEGEFRGSLGRDEDNKTSLALAYMKLEVMLYRRVSLDFPGD